MKDSVSILDLENISKRFGGVQALDNVSASLKQGTITALIGENGAGKSTLVKILAGYYRCDSGMVKLDRIPVEIKSVLHAQELGISVIHQVPSFAQDLSVTDNIFLGREILLDRSLKALSRYGRQEQMKQIAPLLKQYGADFSPSDRMKRLKAYQQRLVGIIKALIFSARILIMDEPTAALPLEERELLLSKIIQLKEEGYCILYVSHHFDEVEKVADEIVALRDGKLSGYLATVPSQAEMIELMTGKRLDNITERYDRVVEKVQPAGTSDTDKETHNFTITPVKESSDTSAIQSNMTLQLRSGDISILTGLVGSGTRDAAEALYGVHKDLQAIHEYKGESALITSPKVAIRRGIGYLSDDRIGEEMFPDFTIYQNLTIPMLQKVSLWWGHINKSREYTAVNRLCGRLKVKMDSIHQRITGLSGGNQQKVMLARRLFTEAKLLILNEPTQGIDVMAKKDVMELLLEFSLQGGICLIATNDPEEFLHAAHRVVVMQRGKVVGDFSGSSIQRETIMKVMMIHQGQGVV
jgi:ribose transport system ATP-binding protein